VPCGCCDGIGRRPQRAAVRNAPGLDAIEYRAGTHGSFVDAMLARLTSHELDETGTRPLAALTTRRRDDPAIALLDGWATVADVLTFHSERIANQGYLRTADERRSLLELARLVGYRLRPGVSASGYLAYTVDPGVTTTIPAGARSVTVPGPGELPQPFETSNELEARGDWSQLPVRRYQPPVLEPASRADEVDLLGTATNLRPGDRVLFALGGTADAVRTVRAVTAVPDEERTTVRLDQRAIVAGAVAAAKPTGRPIEHELLGALRKPPSIPPAAAAYLRRSSTQVFAAPSGALAGLLGAVDQQLAPVLHRARATLQPLDVEPPAVVAFRLTAAPFGAAAPPRLNRDGRLSARDWELPELAAPDGAVPVAAAATSSRRTLPLDGIYEGVLSGTAVVIERAGHTPQVTTIESVTTAGVAAHGQSARVTVLHLADAWLGDKATFADLRATTVHLKGELLELAPERIATPVALERIELDGLYSEVPAGRWVIVAGERSDLPGVSGLEAAELAMVAGTVDRVIAGRPGDVLHTTLVLAEPLAYEYRRETVKVYGNVVKATHGELREQPPTGGDASIPFQEFELAQFPLTYLPAATALGAASTLELRVDDVLWREADSLLDLATGERGYFTRTGDDDRTVAITGDGVRYGVRPATGADNVRLRYRTGTGRSGNVAAAQISQLTTKPLGVTAVVNPLPATGGADREDGDSARSSVPTSTFALERLVSVRDYEDFTRARAGFGKASATLLSDGRQRFVHLTVVGADDAPIARSSDLMVALREALAACGDPHLRVDVAVRELLLIAIDAGVHVASDREWSVVEPQVRAALAGAFGFDRRELGEGVHRSRAVAAIQSVPGVDYVDVNGIALIGADELTDHPDEIADLLAPPPKEHLAVAAAHVTREGDVLPAQLALISPVAPDTILLKELVA
jgi:predicted phage baseplate assembly protein